MVVNVEASSTLDPAAPRLLLEGRFERWPDDFGPENPNYDVSPDGSRFLMVRRKNPVTPTVIEVVLNWPVALGVTSTMEGMK